MAVFKRWNGTGWEIIGPTISNSRINTVEELIAPEYDPNLPYSVGDFVIVDDTLYKCKVAISSGGELWNSAHWTETKIGDEVSDLKSALGEFYSVISGSWSSSKWTTSYYSVFIPIRSGARVKLTAGSSSATYGALIVNGALPPEVGSSAVYSSEDGWSSFKSLSSNTSIELTMPNDANYLYLYAGTNTTYGRLPAVIEIDGIDYQASVIDAVKAINNKALVIDGIHDDVDTLQEEVDGIQLKTEDYDYDVLEQKTSKYGFEPNDLSLFKHSDNLFSDFCYHIVGGYYTAYVAPPGEVRITNTPNWQGWLIRVRPNTQYIMGPLDYRLYFFGKDYVYTERVTEVSDAETNTITTGPKTYWMALTQKSTRDMSTWMMVEGNTYPSEYISGYPQWVAEPLAPDNPSPKTIAFMGDSITAGVGAKKLYHEYLHDKYGWTCLNYGFGGAGFYRNSPSNSSGRIGMGVPGRGEPTTPENFFTPNNVLARLSEVNGSAIDGIVIFAGTNDYGNNVSIADYTTAIENVFDYCQTNFPTKPILVMTPIHREGGSEPNSIVGKNLRDYVDILIEECKKYGIAYIDTMTMSGIHPDNDANRAAYFSYDTTGLHPDDNGHKRIASVVGHMLKEVNNYMDFA